MEKFTTIPKGAVDQPLSQAGLAILQTVQRYHYVTAAQVSRLHYPDSPDENRDARRELGRLAEAGLLLRLTRLPGLPHVFTLGRAGCTLLATTESYFRPSEEEAKARNTPFITHTLATIDVLIAVELLCRTHSVTMRRLLTERELKQATTRVTLPSPPGMPARSVAVIPDAWFELAVDTRKPRAIAVKLDWSTEDQKRWRKKVAAVARWAEVPHQKAFALDTLIIAVVTPDEARREAVRAWTDQELIHSGAAPELAELFLFTCVDPATTPPGEFFFGRCWFEPTRDEPVSLLPSPLRLVVSMEEKEVCRSGERDCPGRPPRPCRLHLVGSAPRDRG